MKKLMMILMLTLISFACFAEVAVPVKPDTTVIFAGVVTLLLAISEFLGMFSKVASNSIFQLIKNVLKLLAGKK